mgnify:CR=1 FL=1
MKRTGNFQISIFILAMVLSTSAGQAQVRETTIQSETLNKQGLDTAQNGKLSDAVRLFQEAIRLRPDYAAAYANLGKVFYYRKQIPEAVAALRPGHLVVDMGSSLPAETRRLAAAAAERGAAFLDAPVSGGVAKARRADLAELAMTGAGATPRARRASSRTSVERTKLLDLHIMGRSNFAGMNPVPLQG